MYITDEEGVVKKFACLTCIKGHRSSGCLHADRELIEIKKKGRPVSQCAECRELRKTKQMHIKCICTTRKSQSIQPPLSSYPSLSGTGYPSGKDLLSSCTHCDRSLPFCICNPPGQNQTRDFYMSSSSSDGTVTPPCDRHASPIPLDNPDQFTFRKDAASAGLPQSRRHFAIPIHDPLDDLDSDTPIYKPEDHQLTTVNCTDVLGELSHTSSEDLMNKIYSRFTHHNHDHDHNHNHDHDHDHSHSYNHGNVNGNGNGHNHKIHHLKPCSCGDDCRCATCKPHPGSTALNRPAAVMDQDGVMLCGCGCQKSLSNCSDCFQDMCEEYLLSHPHP